ncbi:MAG: DNA adenine methylase [Allorhizobium sp.]
MIFSPLRYPGGKGKLYPFFVELIKRNELYRMRYCEPYAGGAGLAIRLLTTGFVERVSINDIDPAIYAFWISILRHADEFCALIERTTIDVDEWHRQKSIWVEGDTSNPLSLGFATYFLNRTNRSGILEGAGPIGGYAQKGNWKIDARLIKKTQIENIMSLSKFGPLIDVTNTDALKYLESNIDSYNSFVYLDPPYYIKGKKLYKNFYEPDDHRGIAELLSSSRGARWVVSYDDVPQIRKLYSSFLPISYCLNYSAARKTVGSEVMYISDGLVFPEFAGFSAAA